MSAADGSTEAANMSQRAIMQCLSLTEWRLAARLPVPAGAVTLDRMHSRSWIELRGTKAQIEIRLTRSGLEAMRVPV